MIWFAWRQFRAQAIVVFGALAALAVLVVVTGLRLRDWYDIDGVSSCRTAGNCAAVTGTFTDHYTGLQTLGGILQLFFPLLIGVFWGAPLLARELETGTYRLAWTQSVTRVWWLTAKIAVAGGASVAAAGALTWMCTWWFAPLDEAGGNKFDPTIFGERDIVPIGYTAFAFALGVVAGLLIRKTLPAMATTVVGYLAARVAELVWVRPNFASARHARVLVQPPGRVGPTIIRLRDGRIPPGSWIVSTHITDPSGHVVDGPIRVNPNDSCVATRSCLAGYHQVMAYQPGSRYWSFQWDETLVFAGAAALLIAFGFWWLTGHRGALPAGRYLRSWSTQPLPSGSVKSANVA